MLRKPDRRIIDFVSKVRTKSNIEKAIFFGSRARGDNFKHSDYDIILVSPDFDGVFFTKRTANMYEFRDFYPLDIEPLCYTPDEFEKMKKRIGIVKHAVEEGIALE
jgi:predicted nucleotidyltransferase